jgi:hypothetical protein
LFDLFGVYQAAEPILFSIFFSLIDLKDSDKILKKKKKKKKETCQNLSGLLMRRKEKIILVQLLGKRQIDQTIY